MESILGLLAMLASFNLIIGGLPSQIRQNHRRKSTEGVSTYFIVAASIAYTFWLLYGLAKQDWNIIPPNLVALLLSFVLLFQVFRYRKKDRNRDE
jgi:uncharacterized protein with PQ loop repeat